jgi:glucokinase
MDEGYVIGMDIGGTKLAVVISDMKGRIIRKVKRPTEAERGPDHVIGKLFEMTHQLIDGTRVELDQVAGIGVSCGGPLDTKTGIVYSPPNLPGWDAIPLKAKIEEEFGIPAIIENDANAGALAEWMFGAGRGYSYVVYMTMGTGIGGGIVVNGRIYHGANDTAGEVGHQILIPDGPQCGCGKRGCLEALCSGPSIARRAREAVRQNPDTLILKLAGNRIEDVRSEHVVEAARQDDPLAMKLIDETAFYMGWGIANMVNILNPEVVIIGTIAVAAGDLLLEPIRRNVRRMAMERAASIVRVLPAQLGEYVGDLAAVALVIGDMKRRR